MDVSSLAASASQAKLESVQGQASVAVLKKSMDIQQQQALQLLEALPQPVPVAPGQPGGVVNTFA
ncbi:putative motility protein [Niveibacterium sp. SC-1]|uniref:putative motility protein n=1 Tax=Niveibacterium sp. SC-1 TaxID=3135646 RepID=UPI00311E6B77